MANVRGKQVSATISPELFTALDDYKWTQKMTLTELIRTAVEEYAGRHGVLPPAPASDPNTPEAAFSDPA